MPFPSMFNFFQRIQVSVIGPAYRKLGGSIYRAGRNLAGVTLSPNSLMPNPNRIPSKNINPDISKLLMVAPTVVIIGNFNSRVNTQIYEQSVIEATENSSIELGKSVIVLDSVIIKATKGQSVHVGCDSIISSKARLHNCTLADNVFIGIGSQVSEGCIIEEYGGLAAGAYLPPNSRIRSNEFWAGSPAKFLRNITEEELDYIRILKIEYNKLGHVLKEELAKSSATIQYEKALHESIEQQDEGILSNDKFEKDMNEQIIHGNHPMTEYDKSIEPVRSQIQWQYEMNKRGTIPEMTYNGLKENFPDYLNAKNETNKVENEVKEKIETDRTMENMNDEIFTRERVQLDDREFKKKY